jgi:hypothetical protein
MAAEQIPPEITPPESVAYSYYQEGKLLSDNPYPPNSVEFSQYQRKMGKLLSSELKSIYSQEK